VDRDVGERHFDVDRLELLEQIAEPLPIGRGWRPGKRSPTWLGASRRRWGG
jgi:hypothetical protein